METFTADGRESPLCFGMPVTYAQITTVYQCLVWKLMVARLTQATGVWKEEVSDTSHNGIH
jgi:hypothetical protein